MKPIISLAFFVLFATFLLSCEEEGDVLNETKEEEITETVLPDGYVIFDSDTFYIVSGVRLNDPNAYRVQMNLASATDIGLASNDGNPQSTGSFILSSQIAPTASGSYMLIAEQGGFTEDQGNFKLGFWSNTEYKYAGQEFFSTGGESIDYVWDNGYSLTVKDIEMTNYFDDTIIIDLAGIVAY